MQLPEFEKQGGEDMYRHFAYNTRYGVWTAFSDVQFAACMNDQKELRITSPHVRSKPHVISHSVRFGKDLADVNGDEAFDYHLFGLGFQKYDGHKNFMLLTSDNLLDKPPTWQLFDRNGAIMFKADLERVIRRAYEDVFNCPTHSKDNACSSLRLIAG